MKKNLSLIFATIVATILLFSCKKDDVSSTAGNGGTAVFKLGGSPSGCTPATLAGIYKSGTALDASNIITLEVDVLSAGTYSFRTNSANGVYFAGSGSFSSTGIQTMVLIGQGTPLREGSFVFATTNNSGCNFTVDFSQGTGGGGGGGTAAVFTYAGAPGGCTGAAPAGTYYNTVGLNAGNYVDLSVNVTAVGTYNITTNSSKGISFSGAGVFASTGVQTLRLTGQGTPNATGAAVLTPTGGCSFTVNIGAAPSPGAFTYNCGTAPVVSGTYTAGTALNATNTIVIAVNVTTVGSYSVSTAAADGVTFSGSGVFTATGASTITLSSTNTPTAAGNFSYTPSGTGGCAFSVTYGTGGGGGSNYYFRFKAAGTLYESSPDVVSLIVDNSGFRFLTVQAFSVTGDTTFALGVTTSGNPQINTTYNTSFIGIPTSQFSFMDINGSIFLATVANIGKNIGIRFTTIDYTNNIVAGTFTGTAETASGTSINITNGEFRGEIQ